MRHRPIEVQARRQRVAALYLKGLYQADIAQEEGISQQQVSHDIRAIKRQWREAAVRDVAVLQQEELERLASVGREAWECFMRSKQDTMSTLKERSNGREKVSLRTEKQVGDPRWLAIIVTCVEKRCAILGLQMPQRHVIAWDSLSDFQLELLANGASPRDVLAMPGPAPMAEA